MPISEEELIKLNPKDKLVKQAKKEFGETFDCREAGYLLEDGTMLDLSGKKDGGSAHTRNYDHREINRALELGDHGIGGTEAMKFMEKHANALRFGCYGTWNRGHDIILSMSTYQNPTEKQLKRVIQCCKLFKLDALNYDIYDKNDDRLLLSKTIEKPNCAMAVLEMKKDLEKAKKTRKLPNTRSKPPKDKTRQSLNPNNKPP